MELDIHIKLTDNDKISLRDIVKLFADNDTVSVVSDNTTADNTVSVVSDNTTADNTVSVVSDNIPPAETFQSDNTPLAPELFPAPAPVSISTEEMITRISDTLHAVARNGQKDKCRELMMKYRVPALSKLDTLTDVELDAMLKEAENLL
jgi:hypothetical protein